MHFILLSLLHIEPKNTFLISIYGLLLYSNNWNLKRNLILNSPFKLSFSAFDSIMTLMEFSKDNLKLFTNFVYLKNCPSKTNIQSLEGASTSFFKIKKFPCMVSPFVCKTIVKIIHLKKVHFPIDLLPLIPLWLQKENGTTTFTTIYDTQKKKSNCSFYIIDF